MNSPQPQPAPVHRRPFSAAYLLAPLFVVALLMVLGVLAAYWIGNMVLTDHFAKLREERRAAIEVLQRPPPLRRPATPPASEPAAAKDEGGEKSGAGQEALP